MELNTEELKAKFLETARNEIHREGLENLLAWLEKSDFFTAPSSTRFHGAYAGGLCQHSLDVLEMAKKFAPAVGKKIDPEALTVACLFHDLCKVNFYKIDYRNQKVDGVWKQIPFYTVEEKLAYGGHGSKSVFLAERFMKLSVDEAVAINCHMGFSDVSDMNLNRISDAYKASALAWLVHVADEASTYLLER